MEMSEENNVIYCGQCGSKNPATFKFCSNCGAKLEKPQEDAFAYGKEDPVFSGEQVQPAVEKVVAEINKKCEEMKKRGEKAGVIGTDSTAARYRADSVKSAGNRGEEAAIARALYRILREFDDEGVTVIYSEAFEDEKGSGGIGQAIMNRLKKAAGYHIRKV